MGGHLYSLSRAVALSIALGLTGCAQPPVKPDSTHLTPPTPAPTGTIPAPVQLAPSLPVPKPAVRPETYSVVVNEVPVQDLLFALARDAKMNVDIHPGVQGRVTLNAIDQTLPQLLQRLARLVEIRWEMQGNTLIVRPDLPYVHIYTVDYLNMVRNVSTTMSVTTGVSSGGGGGSGTQSGGGGSAGTSTADTKIDVKSQNNFWDQLIRNVRDLVVEEDKLRTIAMRSTQFASEVSRVASGQVQGGATTDVRSGPGSTTATTQGQASASGTSRAQAAGGSQTKDASVELASYVFANPNAGILMVRTTSRIHEKIQEYLDKLMARSNLQVLIEATIAEVQLNNQFQQGIDWSVLRNGLAGLRLAQSVTGTSPAGVNSSVFIADYVSQRFTATLRLLDSFGTVKILSSPKISVLNNQTALLKVTDNRVYFTITAQSTGGNNAPVVTTFTTTPHTVAIGFTMNVTPQISDASTVILNLKPLITRVVGFVNDPNPDLARVGVVSRVPEVQSREIESMVRIGSGQIAVMGGLIQDSLSDVEDGVPGLNQVPVFGNLFTHRNRENRKTELVVFIRPLVVRDASIEGDFSSFREYLPGGDFMSRPNPGKPAMGEATLPSGRP